MAGLGYNVFPEDIEGNPQIGHYVEIRATPSSRSPSGALTGGLNFLNNLRNNLPFDIPGSDAAIDAFRAFNEAAGNFARAIGAENTNTSPNQTETFYFFIPGGGQEAMSWQQQHDYTDVKLARVGLGMIGIGGDGAGVLPGLMGKPINPQVEVLFKSTQLRTFQFFFLMSPTSESESNRMKRMIERLRWHAAPQITRTNLFFDPPSEFDIKFYFRPKRGGSFVETDKLPKISKCVVERIDVNYTPQGEFSTFSNGHPVSALLEISFKEMAIVDKNMIARGY
jgi:hypothetical protein